MIGTRRNVDWLSFAVLVLCAVGASGCAQWRLPEIDPTGERIFVAPAGPTAGMPGGPYHDVPGPILGPRQAGVTLSPRVAVAPVGSEVVMLAGVLGSDDYLTTNARVEWMIARGGVGHFVDIDKSSWLNYLVLDFTSPRKINETFAIGTTSRKYRHLTRGTPSPHDDVYMLRGQTWITLTSPVEGASYVTAYSPDVRSWETHTQAATIYWVDALWQFPPPSVNPAGTRHVFTTTVTRQTSHAPVAGWLVRYEILDGPPAGFAPQGATVAEVPTDGSGQASVEIFQKQPMAGTNRIGIQVVRPEGFNGPRFVVGSGATSKTWSAPQIAVRKTGPAAGGVGSTLTYCIELINPGDQPADQVVLTDEVPQGWAYLSSNPPAALADRRLQWNVGAMSAGTRRAFEINLRPEQPGSVTTCAEAAAAGGLRARDCVTTTVGTAAPAVGNARIDLQIAGPDRAAVGDTLTFRITVTNVGQGTATGLVLRDAFGPGLQHAQAPSPIERSLGVDLAPGRSQVIGVELRATQPGTQCQTITVTGNGGVQVSKQACVAVAAPPAKQPPAAQAPTQSSVTPQLPAPQWPSPELPKTQTPTQPPPEPPTTKPPETTTAPQPPATAKMPEARLLVSGPDKPLNVGDMAEFMLQVSNPGTVALTGVQISAHMDMSLDPEFAGKGSKREGQRLVWTLDSLAPGARSDIFQVQCRCKEASPRACVRAQVTAAEGVSEKSEACVEVRTAQPLGGSLTITMVDLRDAIAVGKKETYEIRVTNNGPTPDRDVRLKVALPPELTLDPLGTTGPGGGFAKAEGQTIEFKPVAQLLPGEPLSYSVIAVAKQAGKVTVTATVSSKNVKELSRTESTEIFAEKP